MSGLEAHATMVIKSVPARQLPSLERVIHMELLHDLIRTAVDSGDKDQLAKLGKETQELQGYYEDGEWLTDFDADKNGFFPKELKRGILTEDALYDLFDDINKMRQ